MYSTQFWIFTVLSFFCLFVAVNCFVATLKDRPSIQQRNIFITSGTVIFFILGQMLHYSGESDEMLLLGAKFEYIANICLLTGIYNSLAAFYRTSPNRLTLHFTRIAPIPFLLVISIATGKSSLWPFSLFFKNLSLSVRKGGKAELTFDAGPFFYCYMAVVFVCALLLVGTFAYKFFSSEKKERLLAVKMFSRLTPFLAISLYFTFSRYERPLYPVIPVLLASDAALCAYLVRKEKFRNLYDLSFFAVVDSLYDPLFVTDTDFFVRDANTAAKILFPEYHKANYKNQIQIDGELKRILSQAVYTMEPKNIHIAGREFSPEPHRIERDGILYGYILVLNDVTEQSNKYMQLEHKNLQLSYDYKEIENDLLATRSKIVGGIIQYALEQDSFIGEHMRRTSNYTELLTRQLQSGGKYAATITNEYKSILCQVTPLHDAGKILFVSAAGRTSSYERVREDLPPEGSSSHAHVLSGAKLIDRIFINNPNDLFYTLAKEVTLHHHEWWDGSGYPRGLSGKEIPLSARIVALANEFDLLTAKRPYTVPYSFAEAYTTILSYSGRQFDPEIVDAFKKARKEFLEMYNQVTKQNDTLENIKREKGNRMENI